MVVCLGSEDEMIILHQDAKYATTLYASCPEQACDFVASHGRSKLRDVDRWKAVLASFQKHWISQYPDE